MSAIRHVAGDRGLYGGGAVVDTATVGRDVEAIITASPAGNAGRILAMGLRARTASSSLSEDTVSGCEA